MTSENEIIKVDLPIEDCYPDVFGEETEVPPPDERDETDEVIIEMTVDSKRREVLRDLAEDRLDEDDLPEAETLLWIDQAEVYSLCEGHYLEKCEGAWTGFTENPNYEELRRKMNERLSQGVPCSSCRRDRINELMKQIEDELEISIEVIEDAS
ncbi:hypothetical protein [Halocatena marina]|uniref:hypothetical protein n=1 Tax=Halocatena marina TaxID=2934937 RepID=UPI00200DFB63|nr:hypothetical protein [Halocatena marina]